MSLLEDYQRGMNAIVERINDKNLTFHFDGIGSLLVMYQGFNRTAKIIICYEDVGKLVQEKGKLTEKKVPGVRVWMNDEEGDEIIAIEAITHQDALAAVYGMIVCFFAEPVA